MVRLVFRPYTRVSRTICTSPLRASIRVSPLTLPFAGIVHHLQARRDRGHWAVVHSWEWSIVVLVVRVHRLRSSPNSPDPPEPRTMCPVGGFLVPRWVPVKSNPSDGSSAPSPLRSQKSTFRTHAVIGSAEGADVVLDLFVAPRTSMAVGYIVARAGAERDLEQRPASFARPQTHPADPRIQFGPGEVFQSWFR